MKTDRKPWAIYAITRHGIEIAERLVSDLPEADLYVSEKFFRTGANHVFPLQLPMGPTLEKTFGSYDCHVFVISVGSPIARRKAASAVAHAPSP